MSHKDTYAVLELNEEITVRPGEKAHILLRGENDRMIDAGIIQEAEGRWEYLDPNEKDVRVRIDSLDVLVGRGHVVLSSSGAHGVQIMDPYVSTTHLYISKSEKAEGSVLIAGLSVNCAWVCTKDANAGAFPENPTMDLSRKMKEELMAQLGGKFPTQGDES